MSFLPNPVDISLKTLDYALEKIGTVSEDLYRSRNALPPITEDYEDAQKGSRVAQIIDILRGQYQRGAPVEDLGIVVSVFFFHRVEGIAIYPILPERCVRCKASPQWYR